MIDDYNEWERLLNDNNYFISDIKIDTAITYLKLKGGNNGKEVYDFLPKLIQFCYAHQIDPFISFK